MVHRDTKEVVEIDSPHCLFSSDGLGAAVLAFAFLSLVLAIKTVTWLQPDDGHAGAPPIDRA